MSPQYIEYIVYILLVVVAAAMEYLKIAPPNTAVAILGLVTGHFFGNSVSTTATVKRLSAKVDDMSNAVNNVAQKVDNTHNGTTNTG